MTSKEIIKQIIVKLEDDLQHYTMVDIDRVKAKYIELEIKDYKQVLQDLEHLEALEQENKELKETIEIRKQMNINLIDFGTKLKQKNEKLKKVIEIERNKFNFKFDDERLVVYLFIKELPVHIYTWCFDDKQEYELLKEVIINE